MCVKVGYFRGDSGLVGYGDGGLGPRFRGDDRGRPFGHLCVRDRKPESQFRCQIWANNGIEGAGVHQECHGRCATPVRADFTFDSYQCYQTSCYAVPLPPMVIRPAG